MTATLTYQNKMFRAEPAVNGFLGWYRPRHARRWIEACSAPTYGDAWSQLLALPEADGADKFVNKTSDPSPNDIKRSARVR